MQSLLKGLVVVIFVCSMMTLGVSLMTAYSHRDLAKQVSEMRSKVQQAQTKLNELTVLRPNAPEAQQGVEYWEAELGKFRNANKRREEKEYPDMLLGASTRYAQERSEFDKVQEENIKAGEKQLAEKQKQLRDLVVKVEQARVEHAKAKTDIEALEGQKKELINRTTQSTILLDDVRRRHQEVGEQLEAAKKSSAQP
jgi:superfamily II RNA helicase